MIGDPKYLKQWAQGPRGGWFYYDSRGGKRWGKDAVKAARVEAATPPPAGAKLAKPFTPRPFDQAAKELIERNAKNLGFTHDVVADVFPQKGYSVAVHPDRVRVLDNAPKVDDIRKFHEANKDLLDRDPKARLGCWQDEKTKKWYLDVSHIEPDRATAYKLGHERGEIAIYDLEKRESVEIKGAAEPLAPPAKKRRLE